MTDRPSDFNPDRERFRGRGGVIGRNLEIRARAIRSIRSFFQERGFLEVDTPLLAPAPGMEPHLVPFVTEFQPPGAGKPRELFLISSPEHAMKRLLAAGLGDMFQITRSFRNRELGPLHQPEFTILEWYRVGRDYRALMEDCEALVSKAALDGLGTGRVTVRGFHVDLAPPWERLTVRDAVFRKTGIDLEQCRTAETLRNEAARRGVAAGPSGEGFDDVFFRIFLNHVEPGLGMERPVILCEYPAQLAALSRLKPGKPWVAERFELYIGGLEMANAFSELTDPAEQRRRFEEERTQKEASSGRPFPMDERFLHALEAGLPECAGIALGVDRLVMALAGAETINDVVAFPVPEDGGDDGWK